MSELELSNFAADLSVFSTLQKILEEPGAPTDPWSRVLRSYRELVQRKSLSEAAMDVVLKGHRSEEVSTVLSEMREAERANLELRVAQAAKISPQDVTEQHRLSYYDLLSEQDSTLQRIAKANCKRIGRKLLSKFHPDHDGDRDLFELCKAAIDSGDVELVYILLYRLEGKAEESPEIIVERIKVRIRMAEGSRVFSLFRKFLSVPHDDFVNELLKFLRARLSQLKMMNIPMPTESYSEEESNEVQQPEQPTGD